MDGNFLCWLAFSVALSTITIFGCVENVNGSASILSKMVSCYIFTILYLSCWSFGCVYECPLQPNEKPSFRSIHDEMCITGAQKLCISLLFRVFCVIITKHNTIVSSHRLALQRNSSVNFDKP